MTTYEAITVALQPNLVLVAGITVVFMIVSNRKSNRPAPDQRNRKGYLFLDLVSRSSCGM
ncbi:hypothetical protein [Aquibacillus sediminis]|uniref:hypothetical protein n=1 Tax=Aquibacillus sediminis TaxID=2574734 RepID=UPI001485CC64|nr:hypothetical protein [Aquibacillus sediminis]